MCAHTDNNSRPWRSADVNWPRRGLREALHPEPRRQPWDKQATKSRGPRRARSVFTGELRASFRDLNRAGVAWLCRKWEPPVS